MTGSIKHRGICSCFLQGICFSPEPRSNKSVKGTVCKLRLHPAPYLSRWA